MTAASEVPLADRELFAHWTAKQYAIRFHANDGTERTTDQAFTYGATVTLAKNAFVRTGYTFGGWATSADGAAVYADGKTLEDVSAIQDGVIHLYAVWMANGYEVRFDANGGTGTMEPQVFAYGEEKALRANGFVRTGYTFARWEQRGAAGVRALPDCASVKNLTDVDGGTVTLYAKWTPNEYTVDFNPGRGGSGTMPDQPMTYDEEVALYSNLFSRTGYTFLGWTDDENEVEEVLYYDGVVVSNLTTEADGEYGLYAVWMANAYTVVFDANGGTGTMEPIAFVYDEAQALTSNAFVRADYVFAGWSAAEGTAWRSEADRDSTAYADGAIVSNLTAGADGVVTLCAQWKRGGQHIVPGEKVTIDTGFEGYTVSGLPTGLKYDKNTGKITGSASKPTAAEGVVVKFTKKGFETEKLTIVITAVPKVTVAMEGVNSPSDTDGCKVTGAGAYLVDKKVTLKATVPKGTVFVGWFDGGGVVATQTTYTFTMGKADVALVAKFKKEVMTVGCEALSAKKSFPAGVLCAEGGIKLDNILAESGIKSVKVDKLPAGMKYDTKTGLITGAPTKAGDNKVVITVTANSGAVAKKEIEVKVAAMSETAVGTFNGFVSAGEDNFGTFTLTTTDAGKLTAKVVMAAGSVSFSGTCWDAVEEGIYRATFMTKKGEKLTLALDSTAAWDANQLSGEFTTAAIAETKKTAAMPSQTFSVSAQRNAFSKAWYFVADGNETNGWTLAYTTDTKAAALTVTLKADGTTSVAGRLPNGVDKNNKAVTLSVSASGVANAGMMREGAMAADFAPVLTVNKVKKVLAIRANLWFDRKNDHETGVGEAKFAN